MISFPSLNLLRSTSLYSALDKQTIEQRQQENNAVVSFQHYSSNSASSFNNSNNSFNGNKRPRAASACDHCKRNKKRCSGDEPCKTCKKKNWICSYMDTGQHRKEQSKTSASKRPTHPNNEPVTATDNETICFIPPASSLSSINMTLTQNSLLLSAPPPPAPLASSKSDTSFSSIFVQDPCVNSFGYFGSTNVFSTESRLRSSTTTTTTVRCDPSPSQNLCHINLPTCDQHYLLEVYCQHVDTFYPVFNLDYLKEQLYSSSSSSSTRATSLNTLFFCALFARAAYLVRSKVTSNNLSFGSFSTQFIIYAQCIRDDYIDDPVPTCSTVLALLIMANHLECNRLRHQLPVAWKWAGEACILALNMGLHAKESLAMDPLLYQLRLRTFWLTFITDYTIKTVHGRPFLFDETEIFVGNKSSRGKHPTQLQCTEEDSIYTQRWLERLKATIYFCKGVKKITKFNYSPQQKLYQNHSHYRGYVTSLDHWICDAAKKEYSTSEDNTTTNNMDDEQQRPRQRIQEMTPPVEGTEPIMLWSQRLDRLNDLYFYADAMLLHKRYIEDDTRQKNGTRSVSFETCYHAAEQAIYLASGISTEELEVLATNPVTLYSLIMALQVLGGCCLFSKTGQQQPESSRTSTAELLFEMGYHALHRLPIFQDTHSMMYDTLCHLWDLYSDYCAIKCRRNLSGEVLLQRPFVNNTWSNKFDHPFNAFLNSTTVASFMQNPIPSLSSSLEAGSTKAFAMERQEQNSTMQRYQRDQQPINVISATNSSAKIPCQPVTSHVSLNTNQQTEPFDNSDQGHHHTTASNLPNTMPITANIMGVDPEVIPIAGYEGSPIPSFDPSDLTSTFGFATIPLDSHQQSLWAIPTPNSFSSPTFSSSLYSSPAPDMY